MKTVKMQDVARAAGVSLTTVSRVVNQNGYVAEEKRQAVLAAVQSTGYQLAALPGALPATPARERLVGVVLRKIAANMHYENLAAAISHEADRAGYRTVLLFEADPSNATLPQTLEKLQSFGVSGIIIAGFGDGTLQDSVRRQLEDVDVPVVFIERTAGCYGFNRVLVDNHLGTYQATRHLIQRGHKSLLYLNRNKKDGDVERSRLEGFLRAVSEASPAPAYRIEHCAGTTTGDGYEATKRAFEACPGITGIASYFDGYCAGAMQYLYQVGKRVPDDVELVGNDDTYAPLLAPPISSVQQPYAAIAASAIGLIVENQDKTLDFYAKTVQLEPRLIVRI